MLKNNTSPIKSQIKISQISGGSEDITLPFKIASTESTKKLPVTAPKPLKRALKPSISKAVEEPVDVSDLSTDEFIHWAENSSEQSEEAKYQIVPVKFDCKGKSPDDFDVEVYGAAQINSLDYFHQVLSKAVNSVRINTKGARVTAPVIKTKKSLVVHMYDNIFHWMCKNFDILSKVKAPNGEVYVNIQVADEMGVQNLRVPIESFDKGNLKDLSKYGISINYGYELTVSIYCKKLLDKIPMTSAQQQLGFSYHNNELTFEGYSNGELKTLNSCGTEEDYIEELNELISDSVPIQYLLAASMSAPLMTVLKLKYNLDLHSYIINVVGASSTGKTISSRLCASMWSDPNKDNIFTAMLSTNNAMFKRLGGRFGVPMFLDESTIVGNINTSEFGYTVYEEREKHRLNPDCSERVSGTWNTILVMSSEEHFHASEKSQNGGLVVRIHNADNLAFTHDREHADEISDFVAKNYGVLGQVFVEYLLEHTDELAQRYSDAKGLMRAVMSTSRNSYTDRLCDIYALTYMTAEILSELGVAVDRDDVADIMQVQNRTITAEYNIADNALEAIRAYVVGHPLNSEIRHYYKGADTSAITAVAITESLTRRILAEAGFKDLKTTIRELDKAGYLVRQGREKANGLKSKLHINKVLVVCYQFKLTADFKPLSQVYKTSEIECMMAEEAEDMDFEE